MVRLEDVAKKAGISKTTVSRVLNGDETITVTDQTRKKIMDAVNELGYKPLRRKKVKVKSYNVAMIHNDEAFKSTVDRAYYFSVRNGIEKIAIKKKINIVSVPLEYLTTIQASFDGAIILGNLSTEDYEKIRKYIQPTNVVVVGIQNPFPDEYDQVSFNTANAIEKVIDYLHSLGHELIGCLGAEEAEGIRSEDSRKVQFIKKMKSHNQYKKQWIIFGDKGISGGHELAEKLLEQSSLPTAVFVANDPTAIGVMQALQDRGMKIPEDISVIGFNGDYTTEYTYPPLTTLKINTNEMGQEAVFMLLERMKDYRTIAKKVELATNVIERQSCKDFSGVNE